MDEETLFWCTDELLLRAKEDQLEFVKYLEQHGFKLMDVCEELRLAASRDQIDWSRIFILAVLGVQLNAEN